MVRLKCKRKKGSRSSPSFDNARTSELEAHGELQLAGIRSSIFPGSRADRSLALDIARGTSVVDVIEEIECVHPELSEHGFVDGEVLLYGQIRIEEVWSKDTVSSDTSNLSKACRCKYLPQRLSIKEAEIVSREAGDVRMELARISIDVARSVAGYARGASAKGERER